MTRATTFREILEQANNAGAMTAEQIDEVQKAAVPASQRQLTTLAEVMMRKHSTSFNAQEFKQKIRAA